MVAYEKNKNKADVFITYILTATNYMSTLMKNTKMVLKESKFDLCQAVELKNVPKTKY